MADNVFLLNHRINQQNPIVIFGTGINGKRAYFTFLNMGIEVYAFADRDIGQVGKRIFGKEILFEDNLIETDFTVVIASKAWKEICRRLEHKGISRLFVMNMYGENDKGIEI